MCVACSGVSEVETERPAKAEASSFASRSAPALAGEAHTRTCLARSLASAPALVLLARQ